MSNVWFIPVNKQESLWPRKGLASPTIFNIFSDKGAVATLTLTPGSTYEWQCPKGIKVTCFRIVAGS